jgi:glutathione S-transferase
MSDDHKLVFFHSPNTRSVGVRILLEELAAPHELRVLNMKAGEQRQPEYLAINPMGKVPAILYGNSLVTEQVAIFIYLSDLFPAAGLTPAPTDPLRGPFLRWLVYYAACLEPAIIDKHMKRDPAPLAMCPYGDYDTMLNTLVGQLAKGPYILGETFTTADVLWGVALGWMVGFGMIPAVPEISAYLARIDARPNFVKVRAEDEALAAKLAAAAS